MSQETSNKNIFQLFQGFFSNQDNEYTDKKFWITFGLYSFLFLIVSIIVTRILAIENISFVADFYDYKIVLLLITILGFSLSSANTLVTRLYSLKDTDKEFVDFTKTKMFQICIVQSIYCLVGIMVVGLAHSSKILSIPNSVLICYSIITWLIFLSIYILFLIFGSSIETLD
jgi:hypothetical protein